MNTDRPILSCGLAAIAAVLLSVGGFLSLRDSGNTQPQPLMGAVEADHSESASKPQYLSKDIRDLQVMQDRVLADNPLADNPLDVETESPLGEIVPSEWRVVRLEHTEPNGTRHIIERGMPLDELTTVTARPSASIGDFEVDESWQPGDPLPEYFDESEFPIDPSVVAAMLVERSAASNDTVAGLPTEPLIVGSTIFVDLPEHGISADFTVSAILPCPTPNPSDGYLVTTKFIHENAEILDLRIEGSADVIGTTSSHPFWSEDRQQFVAAGALRVGENLRLADDTTRRLESLTLRENRETVYNIEVDGEHDFYVGEDGVLVHNTCDWRMWEKQAGKYFRRKGFDVVGSIRNASGHGIDMVLRNRTTGEIFIAEVKARTRGWGGLSNLQRKGAEANARRILDALGTGHWAPHNQLPGSGTVADVLQHAIDNKNFGGGFLVQINEGLRGLRELPWLP